MGKKNKSKKAKKEIVEAVEETEEKVLEEDDEHGDDDDHGEDEEYDEDEDYDDDDEDYDNDEDYESALGAGEGDDPYWWTPHAVLGTLLFVALLGFFGFFNGLLPHGDDKGNDVKADPAKSAKPAAVLKKPAPAKRPPVKRPGPKDPIKVLPVKRPPRDPSKPIGAAKKIKAVDNKSYGARQILITYKGAMRAPASVTRTKEKAQKRAKQAAGAARGTSGLKGTQRTASWKKLVQAYSDEPDAVKRGGDMGRFTKGSYHPAFVAAVDTMKVDAVSGVVETPLGFHVIWRTQ